MLNFYAQKDIRSNRTTNISTQDCWISGCGILERLPDAVGDEVYSDHPQDCSLDISKVRLCRHVYTYEVTFLCLGAAAPTHVSGVMPNTRARGTIRFVIRPINYVILLSERMI